MTGSELSSSELRGFTAPTRIIAGLGAVEQLGAELERLGCRRIAIVCDRGVAQAGLLERVQREGRTGDATVCALVDPDPTVQAAEDAAAGAIELHADAVLAIGGGSALGVGKAVAVRLTNEQPIDAYVGRDRADSRPAPCVAVPTTAGSGSEVSNALVLHDPGREHALIVRGRGYEPRVALLDGALLETLPARPLREAALDALSHALEALWARGASAFTDALALRAAHHIYATLPRALDRREPRDLQLLLEASAMANLACGSAELGLVHALSSAVAVRLPHGYQNGVLLPHVAAFNRLELGAEAAAAADGLADLYEAVGFDARFRDRELSPEDVDRMVSAALRHPFRTNNIRAASEADLLGILASAGAPARATAEVIP
jgi:alcohol dehydrogenase class IV